MVLLVPSKKLIALHLLSNKDINGSLMLVNASTGLICAHGHHQVIHDLLGWGGG